MTLLLVAVSLSLLPVPQVKAGEMAVSQPMPIWLPVFRGGTFGFSFKIWLRGWPYEYTSVSYEFTDPLDPVLVTWDPEPPATIPADGDTRIYFNLTVPVDAPLGTYYSNLFVKGPFGMNVPFGPGRIDVLRVEVDFDPAFIYVGEGDWVYCHIEPPETTNIFLGAFRSGAGYKTVDYDPYDIAVSTIWLNDTISADPSFAEIDDFDGDDMLDLKVAFNRSEVEDFILSQGITNNNVTLEVTGQFSDGWAFAGSNQVELVTPEQAILDLIDIVESMNLQQGIENSLDAKLSNVLASLEALNAGQRNDTINKLYAFINEVDAQRGNKITDEQADYLIAEAQRIIDLIES